MSAVLLTSVIFGVGHVFRYESLGAVLGRLTPPALTSILLGALFLGTQTLFFPFIIHVAVNSVGVNLGRKRLAANDASRVTRDASMLESAKGPVD